MAAFTEDDLLFGSPITLAFNSMTERDYRTGFANQTNNESISEQLLEKLVNEPKLPVPGCAQYQQHLSAGNAELANFVTVGLSDDMMPGTGRGNARAGHLKLCGDSEAEMVENVTHWDEQSCALETSTGAFFDGSSTAFSGAALSGFEQPGLVPGTLCHDSLPDRDLIQALLRTPMPLEQKSRAVVQQQNGMLPTHWWQDSGLGPPANTQCPWQSISQTAEIHTSSTDHNNWESSGFVAALPVSRLQDLETLPKQLAPRCIAPKEERPTAVVTPNAQGSCAKGTKKRSASQIEATESIGTNKKPKHSPRHPNISGYQTFAVKLPGQPKVTNVRRGKPLSERDVACRKRGACIYCRYHKQKVKSDYKSRGRPPSDGFTVVHTARSYSRTLRSMSEDPGLRIVWAE